MSPAPPLLADVARALASGGGTTIPDAALRDLVGAYAACLHDFDRAMAASSSLLAAAVLLDEQGHTSAAHVLRGLVVAAEPRLQSLGVHVKRGPAAAPEVAPLGGGERPPGTTAASPLARFQMK